MRKHVLAFLVGCFVLSLIPFVYLRFATGTFFPEILHAFTSDQTYYLAQFSELASGHLLLGNPFLREYAHVRSPGLLLPIWVAGLPMLFGASVNATFLFNIVAYTFVSGLLFFFLFRKAFSLRLVPAVVLSLLSTASVHDLLIRPVSFQLTIAVFLLWITYFFLHLEHSDNHFYLKILSGLSVLAFYTYPHLWLIVFATLGLYGVSLLLSRQYAQATTLLRYGCIIVLFCIPQLLLMLRDIFDPALADLSYRVGAFSTHAVSPLTLLNLKYMILSVFCLLLIRLARPWKALEQGVFFLCSALVVVSVSNVLTGTMILEAHMIPWRFSLFLHGLIIVVLWRSMDASSRYLRMTTALVVLLLTVTSLNRIAPRANAFHYIPKYETYQKQYEHVAHYTPLMKELQKFTEPQVVLAPLSLANYVPIYTEHYSLLAGGARYNPVPTAELLERFLVQDVDYIDHAHIEEHMAIFSGVGPKHEFDTRNGCVKANLCPASVAVDRQIDLLGGEELLEEALALHQSVQADYASYLEKYDVSLIVIDDREPRNPRVPGFANLVWKSGNLHLYEVLR